ncbi:RHS repeat domain-containing protein, partial [Aeromonas simiae]|uniref:RHS repeat domain-containing protein n=1 Tax=Aeromonas simiae TaxID=218936 RepID=UPI00266DC8A5
TFIYEPGSFKPLAQLEGEGQEAEVFHYQLDHLGTPLALTRTSGATAWQVRYRAYGNVWREEIAEVTTPLRFQGQYFDAETVLHYNRHRYYQPDTGRFITPDPIGLAGGLNNYQYAPNPTGWVDPLGLSNLPGQCPDTLPRARISAEEQDVFKQFEQHHAGQFKDDHELVSAFENVRDNASPWPVGFTPKTRVIQPGERFNMITNEGRSQFPGQYGTPNDIPSASFGREKLAIKEEWKGTLDRKVTYEVQRPFDIEYGPVGAQIEKMSDGSYKYYPGGGEQIRLLYKDFENAVPNKQNKYTEQAYLKVIDDIPLLQE